MLRCGKSCRLRWMNYLRPDIKRGNITSEEEDLIIRLHSLLGNRWSLIAGRLPGRTDNEIKNHWNTHLSKRLRSQGTDPNTHKMLPPTNFDDDHNNSSKKSKKKQNKKKKKKVEKEEEKEKREENDEEREKRTIVYLPKAIRVRALCSPSPSTPSSDSYNNMNIINNNNNVGRLLYYSNNSTTSGLINYNNNDNDENNESGLGVFLEDEMVNDEMLVKGSEMERMYDEYLQLLTSQQEEDMLMIQDFDHHHHHLDLESFAQSLLV